jgi:hypothetical protein
VITLPAIQLVMRQQVTLLAVALWRGGHSGRNFRVMAHSVL